MKKKIGNKKIQQIKVRESYYLINTFPMKSFMQDRCMTLVLEVATAINCCLDQLN